MRIPTAALLVTLLFAAPTFADSSQVQAFQSNTRAEAVRASETLEIYGIHGEVCTTADETPSYSVEVPQDQAGQASRILDSLHQCDHPSPDQWGGLHCGQL